VDAGGNDSMDAGMGGMDAGMRAGVRADLGAGELAGAGVSQ
jgi:hypothetical protein